MPQPLVNREAITSFFAAVAADQRPWGSHGLPRASSIGNDLLQQYFELLPHTSATPRSGEELWGMDEGHWQEPRVYEVLRQQGYMVTDVQGAAVRYIFKGTEDVRTARAGNDESLVHLIDALRADGHLPIMTMHIDGVIEGGPDSLPRTLLELKKLTLFSYSGIVQSGVWAEKRAYYMQAHVGADSFDTAGARMYVFAKDRSAVNWLFHTMRSANPIDENETAYCEDFRRDDLIVRQADFRAQHLLQCLAQGEAPVRDAGISPMNIQLAKDGTKSRVFPCSHCGYVTDCLQLLWKSGENINDLVVVKDNRTKKQRELDERQGLTYAISKAAAETGGPEDLGPSLGD